MFTNNQGVLKKFILIGMAMILALSGFGFAAQTTQAAQPADCTQFYTVQRGDYLVKIGRMFDVDWRFLARINNLEDPTLIFPGQRLCVSTSGAILPETGGATVPSFTFVNVREGRSVTVRTQNFPANVIFNVLMGRAGTRGIGGIRVDRINSGSGGSFTDTYQIPDALEDERRIVLRFDSPTTNFFAFNTFTNVTTAAPVTEPEGAAQFRTTRISFEERVDFFLGNAGIFMPSSNYTAILALTRWDPSRATTSRRISFTQQLLEVRVFDSQGDEIEDVFGLNYVYFNLSSRSRNAWDRGDLNIYHFNPSRDSWTPCGVTVFVPDGNGRLSCVIQDFGLYGLAIQH